MASITVLEGVSYCVRKRPFKNSWKHKTTNENGHGHSCDHVTAEKQTEMKCFYKRMTNHDSTKE